MNIEIFALCDAATDSQGKLNILGAFDALWATSFPTIHPQCAVALRIRFKRIEQGQHRIILHLVDEDGQLVIPPLDGPIEIPIHQSERSAATNFILNIQSLKIEKPGEYAVNLAIDGRQEASIPLTIKLANQPPSAI